MSNTTKTVLINYDQIERAVKRLAEAICRDYPDKDPLLLCVMNGGFMFFSDLVRQLTIPHQIDFIRVSTYGDKETAEQTEWVWRSAVDVHNRHVLVVDDIVDTGSTAEFVGSSLRMHGATSVTFCTLLSRMDRRQHSIFCPYVGFDIDDHFVYGYGLDKKGRNRHLLDIFYEE